MSIWTGVKHNSEVELAGVTVEIDKTDTTLNCITLTDANGNTARIRMSSYSMYLEVPAKPKLVKKFAVKGTFRGIDVNEVFDNQYQAEDRSAELDREVEVTEVEVPEEAA